MALFEPLTTTSEANFSQNALIDADPTFTEQPSWRTKTKDSNTSPRRISFTGRLAAALALIDLIAIAIGFGAGALLADSFRAALGYGSADTVAFLSRRADELALLAGFAISIFAFGGLYRQSSWETDELRGIVGGVILIALIDATFQFALRDHNSRLWFITSYPMIVLSVISLRMAVRGLPSVREAMTNHVVLVGTNLAPDLLIYEMRESRSGPVKLLHSLPLSEMVGRDPQMLNHLIDRLARNAGMPTHRVSIIVAPTSEEIEQAQVIIDLLNTAGLPSSLVLPFTGLARNGVRLQKVVGADMVMAELHTTRRSLSGQICKRLFDLVCSVLILTALLPVLAILGGLLSLEKGPILFRQPRVGRGGRKFSCYKFRSMRPDAQERLEELLAHNKASRIEWNDTQKLQNDPRITPIGAFMRKTSLDELPQIVNVLLGDMSLVGPRPIIAPEVSGYHGDRAYYESPDFDYYSQCTPGITGLWQVSGRSTTRHEERIRLDRWYARNWSFWLDLMILFKTVRVVLSRSGSA